MVQGQAQEAGSQNKAQERRQGGSAPPNQLCIKGNESSLPQLPVLPYPGLHLMPFKAWWLSSKEDQSTHWAGQKLPSASSIHFQPPWFVDAVQNELGR